jgi:hypothetical protein
VGLSLPRLSPSSSPPGRSSVAVPYLPRDHFAPVYAGAGFVVTLGRGSPQTCSRRQESLSFRAGRERKLMLAVAVAEMSVLAPDARAGRSCAAPLTLPPLNSVAFGKHSAAIAQHCSWLPNTRRCPAGLRRALLSHRQNSREIAKALCRSS